MANRIEAEVELRVEKAADRLVDMALCEIAEKYEDVPFEEQLAYHNTIHTVNVMVRTELILRTIMQVAPNLVNGHKIQLGRVDSSGHDIDIIWRRVGNKRVREMGVSETSSSDKTVDRMRRAKVFGVYDYAVTDETIMATAAAYDPDSKSIYQPNLKKGADVVTVAVALADLNCCGLEGAEAFLKESDQVFVEENMDIAEALAMGGVIDEGWKQRIISGAEFSVNFAKGRKARIDSEIACLPGGAIVHEAVRELFWGFDESIAAARATLERRRDMSVEELFRELGSVLPA